MCSAPTLMQPGPIKSPRPSLLGSVAGTIPALLLVTATGMARTAVVPWLQLAALLVAVPLTGAGRAWLFTRAKLPVPRREVGT